MQGGQSTHQTNWIMREEKPVWLFFYSKSIFRLTFTYFVLIFKLTIYIKAWIIKEIIPINLSIRSTVRVWKPQQLVIAWRLFLQPKKWWKMTWDYTEKRVAHVFGIGSIRFSSIKFTQIQKWPQPRPLKEIVCKITATVLQSSKFTCYDGPCLYLDGMLLHYEMNWPGTTAHHHVPS